MLLQLLPVILILVMLVVVALTGYQQSIMAMLRHNRVLQGYEAAVFNISPLQELPEEANNLGESFRIERLEEIIAFNLIKVEVRAYDSKDNRLVANTFSFEYLSHEN